MLETIYNVDFAILEFIRENLRCGFMDIVMMIFTFAGNYGIVWNVIAIALFISKKYRRLGASLAVGLIACLVIGNIILKPLVARDRPFITDPSFLTIIPPPSGNSFPSGHTFSSFVSASILAMHSRKAGISAFGTAVLIAFSRLYFCVHFPTDVLCGAILGIVTGITVYRIMNRKAKEDIPKGSSES
ncbi:MAG: phosphatase PAP2 family protein [Oscillospiraceae bacterium]|nr:phosphatase PAP2 family protein [Oscillospiraceae bacterium]